MDSSIYPGTLPWQVSIAFTVESGSTFTPFWRRLPSFFVYPLQMGSILRIIGYSLYWRFLGASPIHVRQLLYVILWIVFLKYAFLVLERTANGRFDEPGGLQDKEAGDAWQVMRQYGLFIILGILVGVLGLCSARSGSFRVVAPLNIVVPAGIMIIAVKRSLGAALNPATDRVLYQDHRVGLIWRCAVSFSACFPAVIGCRTSCTPYGFMAGDTVADLVDFYFVLIIYHMMGYAIYQYHEALGVFAAVSFEDAEAKLSSGKGSDPVLAKLGTLIANGQQEEAIELLRGELRTRWESNDLHERYHKLLLASGKQVEALQHAREFIAKLVTEKRLFQALDLSEQCLKLDPDFQLQDSFHVHDLAVAARMGRRPKLALDLMRRFDRRYPNHPNIPPVYLLSAQILSEHYKMDKEALQILQALQTKFPDHDLAKEALQYQEVLNKIAAII